MGFYYNNRQRARTFNNEPSLTDQSGAKDTDINIIVQKFKITGTVPGAQGQPMGGDFTQFPTDLRDLIHTARDLNAHRQRLPAKLRNIPLEELLALTPEQLNNILTPPAPPPAEPKGDDNK